MTELETIADTRSMLLKHIEENPGIRYRELLRMTGLINGVLTYHLTALERADVIKVDRQTRMTRYYPLSISDKESGVLKFIRHEPIRQILIYILKENTCTFNEIVEHIQKAPSTVSCHLKRLKEAGIISIRYGEYHQIYKLTDKELIAEVLSKYRTSFADKVIDNYTDMMEGL